MDERLHQTLLNELRRVNPTGVGAALREIEQVVGEYETKLRAHLADPDHVPEPAYPPVRPPEFTDSEWNMLRFVLGGTRNHLRHSADSSTGPDAVQRDRSGVPDWIVPGGALEPALWRALRDGGFELLEPERDRGRGGTGCVYRARLCGGEEHSRTVHVAVKVLKPGYTVSREVRALISARHEHIAQLYAVPAAGDRCLVMEFLPGGLYDRTPRYEPRAAAKVILEIALAVQHAHELGVFHRDLKPVHVRYSWDDRPKLIDFGLSGSMDGAGMSAVSPTGEGTPDYRAPEQVPSESGEEQFVTVRTDVYGSARSSTIC